MKYLLVLLCVLLILIGIRQAVRAVRSRPRDEVGEPMPRSLSPEELAAIDLRARVSTLMSIHDGTHIRYQGVRYQLMRTVTMQAPDQPLLRRLMLDDGSDEVRWVDIHRWPDGRCHRVNIARRCAYGGTMPDVTPQKLEYEGVIYTPEQWIHGTYTNRDMTGKVQRLRYVPAEGPLSRTLHFERYDGGRWVVSIAEEISAMELLPTQ